MAGIGCLLPRVGIIPASGFGVVRLGAYFYVGAALGLGLVTQTTGLSDTLGGLLQGALTITAGADLVNFITLTLLATAAGLAAESCAHDDRGRVYHLPASVSGAADHGGDADGCARLRTMLRLLLPLDHLWWHPIGFFG